MSRSSVAIAKNNTRWLTSIMQTRLGDWDERVGRGTADKDDGITDHMGGSSVGICCFKLFVYLKKIN